MIIDELIKAVEAKWAGYLLTFNEIGHSDYNLWCYKKLKGDETNRQDFEGKTLREVFEKALQSQPK